MPYPSQIDPETIIESARQMIESDGAENLSLRTLAKTLGVQAPSLYRYFANKTSLLKAVNELTTRSLLAELYQVADEKQPVVQRLSAIAHAYRRFAHENPACYGLAFANPEHEIRADAEEREQLVLPLQAIMAEWVGTEKSLPALRGIYAFLHGWVMLEITAQFERGGNLDEHFEMAFQAYLIGWK